MKNYWAIGLIKLNVESKQVNVQSSFVLTFRQQAETEYQVTKEELIDIVPPVQYLAEKTEVFCQILG